ncbi:MAG TPA: hypothetical protein VGU74_04175 [Gemmatimonadales bacterium]|nr:hypothetical protein [Gemmatimonadales bacterium]
MAARPSWSRLILATLAFVVWAHPSLVGLPCAALLLIAPPPPPPSPQRATSSAPDGRRPGGSHVLAGLIGALSVALLVLTAASGSRLGAVTSTYIVLVTAAFVSFVLLRPEGPPLNRALRSIALAGLATAALIQIVWGHVVHGSEAWSSLGWEATRQASFAMRYVVELSPPQWVSTAFALHEPAVRFASITWPGMLALQTLAGLALALQLHLRLTSLPLGAPLARFRDFAIGDGWVWGIVAWIAVLILPVSSALHVAGTNVGLVAGTLYVLRGAAIVTAFAEAFGISAVALVITAAAAAAFAVPLIFIVPGLCTLGITDTWYQYRRRLAAGIQPNQRK